MSDDEVFVLLMSFIGAGTGAILWYRRLYVSPASGRVLRLYIGLGAAPLLALVAIFIVLRTAASFDVRNAPEYLGLYTVLGAAWIFLIVYLMEQFGISFRDDAVERRNLAAAIVIVCALAAHAAIYAGANIGDGPGWWCVVAAGLIGASAWFLMWSLVEFLCAVSEEVTVERDLPSAVRLGGYMIAMGIVCGRGSAGDWTSLGQTLVEFQAAWPILPLTGAAIAFEQLLRGIQRSDRPGVTVSTAIAAVYLLAGVLAVEAAGPPPDNTHYDRLG